MDAQEPKAFDRAGFKTALLAKIAAIAPKNLKEADEFKKDNKATEIKGAVVGQVKAGKEMAQGPIAQTATEAPDPAAARPKSVTPLPPTEAGVPPPAIAAADAAPKPRSAEEISLQAESQGLDRQISEAGVTEQQLRDSNEPSFQAAAQAKTDAQTNAAQAPVAYRQDEQALLADAQAGATAVAGDRITAMHAVRKDRFGQVVADQLVTGEADKQARAEVARHVEQIFENTRTKVQARLANLDKEVNDLFDRGAEQARKDFETYVSERMSDWKLDRYLKTYGGWALWLKDQFLGLPEEVNAFFEKGRELYINQMDKVIDQVALAVETGLNAAKQLVATGLTEVRTYVDGLPEDLRQVGDQAAEKIQDKFDTLRQSVDEKGDQLVDQLARKYVESLQKVDERIDQMKSENRGFVDQAKDALKGAIDTIAGLKTMLLGVLAKAADAIDRIIGDPIGFLGNLVSGVKSGLNQFVKNLTTHLKKGLSEWLFGALAGAGLQIPETLDPKGIIGLVLQVLGLTYAAFRARAVAIVGEPIVKALEEAAEVFRVLVTEGVAGLWRFIKEKLGDLKTMILDPILAFVRDRVIIAGITWLIGLLNPASAFIKACKAIYDIVMFFVNRGAQILSLVNAVIDSISAIAKGALTVAAGWVENALARAVPVAIAFLASLLGLGDPATPVRNIIEKVRTPIFAAMDWVINQAVKVVKPAGKFIGSLFGNRGEGKATAHEDEPEKAGKIEAGLAAIHIEERNLATEGALTKQNAQQLVARVRSKHSVFKTLDAVPRGEQWSYEYTASPRRSETSHLHVRFAPEEVFRMVQDIARVRFSRTLERVKVKSKEGQSPLAIRPGDAPEQLGAGIRTRAPSSVPSPGKTVSVQIGDVQVSAKQGSGAANVIVAGLGKYPEIADKLRARGFDGPKIHNAVAEALKTGRGDVDIMRLIVLMSGAEVSRLDMATVTGPLAIGQMGKGRQQEDVFGSDPIFPEAIPGAAKASRRAAELVEGKTFSAETKIQASAEDYIQRVVELTFLTVKDKRVKSLDQLKARILEALERHEKEVGVKS